jgi:hypothetical protein
MKTPSKISARLLYALAILAIAPSAHSQLAWFSRHTDSIRIPGQTVLQTTATYETRFWMPVGSDQGGFIFDEWTDGQEDKRIWAGPFQVAGNSYPQSVSSAPKGIVFSQARVSPETWHHLAFVTDPDSDRLYLDGRLVAEMPRSVTIGNGSGEGRIGAILRSNGTTGELTMSASFIGFLDYVRLSNTARYKGYQFDVPQGDLASDANTLLLYNFNDAPDSEIAIDESPLKRHGSLGQSFDGATKPLLVTTVSNRPEPWSTNVPINPRATYLRVNNDGAFNAIPIDLEHLGIQPGASLFLSRIGDFVRNIEASPRDPERAYRMAAVFSSSATLLGPSTSQRVQGAIDAGLDLVTPSTASSGFPTDIPEDFEVPGTGIWVEVPPGGRFLFIAAVDSQYNDNYDLDFNYGVHIERLGLRSAAVPGGMLLDWNRGTLQQSASVEGEPWIDRPNSKGPLIEPPNEFKSFFRLRQ